MINLDAFEACLLGYDARLAGQTELRALAAELRAARKVVKAARGGSHPDLDEDEAAAQLADALDAYDRAVFR